MPAVSANAHFRTFPIPCAPGHDVVYGLARGRGREIYLAPSNEFAPGLCAAVYAFDPKTERFREVIDIGEATGFDPASGLMPHSKVHLCLQSTSDGRAFAGTHFTAPAVGQTSFDAIAALRGRYPGMHLLEYDPNADRVVDHGLLVPGEGARIACLDEQHGQYYFLSYPRNHLFRYDYHKRRLHDLGRMGQENAFGLEVDSEGNVYTSDDLGRFWRYSFARDRLEALDLYVPLAPGRSPKGNYIRRMIVGADGCLYGCGNKGMRFFRLDPQHLKLDDFGPLVGHEKAGPNGYPRLPPAKAIAAQSDGSLLIAFGGDGIYLDKDPIPRLFRFDPMRRATIDLGLFICGNDALPAWIPQCAVSTPSDASTYFGLQQTVGQLRLWRYEPNETAGDSGRAVRSVPGQPADPADSGGFLEQHRIAVARQPFGASIEGTAALPFIAPGRIQMQELGWLGEDHVIPPGESAIGDLVLANNEVLYGLTVGERAHLFSYRPDQQNRFTENYEVHPWDLGTLGSRPVQAGRIFVDAERRRLLLALLSDETIALWTYPIGAEFAAYRGVYHSVPHGPPVHWTAPPWTTLSELPPEALRFESLSYEPCEQRFYALNSSGRIVSALAGDTFAIVPATGLPPLLHLRAGNGKGLWAVSAEMEILLLHDVMSERANRRTIGRLSEPATVLAVSSAGRLAVGGITGTIGIFDGEIAAPPLTHTLERKAPVRALAWHDNDVLWGFAGGETSIGHAFCWRHGKVEELGILQVPSQPRYWMAHRCDAIVAGPGGEAYYGEHDRIAHLFRVS